LKEDIQVKNNEAQRESRKKEKMERELKTAKTELESKGGELKTKQNQLQKALDDISRLEQQLKEQRVSDNILTVTKKPFFNLIVFLWNNLSPIIRNSSSVSSFKHILHIHYSSQLDSSFDVNKMRTWKTYMLFFQK
jgi:hypothetical protein